jgi:ketosteroid isomerase-like protein
MGSERTVGPNEKLLRDACAHSERGEFHQVVTLFSPTIRWRSPGKPNRLETAGDWESIDEVHAYAAISQRHWTMEAIRVHEIIAHDDTRFAVQSTVDVRHNMTDKVARVEKVDLVTMKDGKICDFAEFLDTAVLERAARPR